MRPLATIAVLATALPLATLAPLKPAHAQAMIQSQEGIALENQILQLKSEIQQGQSGGGSSLGGNYPPPSNGSNPPADGNLVGNLLNQVNQLQSQVQALSGRVDELQNQVQQNHDQQEKEIGDLRFQVTNGGGGNGGTPPQGSGGGDGRGGQQGGSLGQMPQDNGGGGPQGYNNRAPGAPPAAHAAAGGVSPKQALAAAEAAYAQKDYADAALASKAALAAGKSTPIGAKAQFIYAQSLAGQGKQQQAALAFDDAYNADRNGPNAPASLLGLADSLSAIHQNSAACDTLASLNSQFPDAPSSLRPRIEAARHRAGCR